MSQLKNDAKCPETITENNRQINTEIMINKPDNLKFNNLEKTDDDRPSNTSCASYIVCEMSSFSQNSHLFKLY